METDYWGLFIWCVKWMSGTVVLLAFLWLIFHKVDPETKEGE